MTVEPLLPAPADPVPIQTGPSPADEAEACAPLTLSNAKGRTLLRTDCTPVLIGRHRRCHLSIDDDRASKAHAALACIDGRWYAADLFSTNGTCLNGAPLDGVQPLRPGDRILVGHTHLHVSYTERPDPREALEAAAADLQRQRQQVEASRADFFARSRDLDDRAKGLDEREAGVQWREGELERREGVFVGREDGLTRQLAEVAERERSAIESESDLRTRRAEVDRRDAE
ncbi:MAG: FHA domain-containing protein, partial [Phycisphaerae bacterium]